MTTTDQNGPIAGPSLLPKIKPHHKITIMKQLKGAMALWGILSCGFVSYGQQETLMKSINCGGNQVTGDDGFVNGGDTTATEVAAHGIALGAMYRLL